jgi:plastocyanin domain-containing protein
MAEITSPHKSGGLSQAVETFFQCLKNMFDGSLPVEDMEGNMNK